MVNVIKADGTREPFDRNKVLYSMLRAGYPEDLAHKILTKTEAKLYDNIQTWEIYQDIQHQLATEKAPFSKARYGLKQSIMMLGPTGYPFEDFIAEILEAEGYKTAIRQMLRGVCVMHEIDVVAEREDRKIMVEAKFHNNPGARSDLHVAMYTKARFDDVKEKNNLDHCILVTNTKASVDAVTYATCTNYQIISWDYPKGTSLRETIEKHHLHPITMLTSIGHGTKLNLLENHVVLIRDIVQNPGLLNTTHLPQKDKDMILREAEQITSQHLSINP